MVPVVAGCFSSRSVIPYALDQMILSFLMIQAERAENPDSLIRKVILWSKRLEDTGFCAGDIASTGERLAVKKTKMLTMVMIFRDVFFILIFPRVLLLSIK